MPRYIGPARFVGYKGNEQLQDEGRRLLGDLKEYLRLGGIKVGRRERTLSDGTRIIAIFDGTTAITEVIRPRESVADELVETPTDIWIPQGFVLYPATSEAPAGWGLPVVQQTVDENGDALTPYATVNINPGIDVSRWTPGGALGQVLLTRHVNAGYPDPDSFVVPLFFSRAAGPRVEDDWTPGVEIGSAYAAYRLRLTGFADTPAPGSTLGDIGAAQAFRRGVFERINEHRVSIGRDPVEQPIHGVYNSAQGSADIQFLTHTAGHFSERYPITYRTPEDRMSKDGLRTLGTIYPAPNSRNYNYGEIVFALTTQPPELIGTDPNGVSIYNIVGGGRSVTAQDAFDGWMASPPHRATIESTTFDRDGMAGTVVQPAQRANYADAHFIRNDQWIGCGNRVFECPDGLSPISWFGPPTLNLAWETWPVFINTDVDEPLVLLTTNFAFNNDESTWFAYFSTTRETDYRLAWSRGIYSAGRCIAYAPGLVWAAGVHKLANGRYRLIVLTHNEADQLSDKLANGMTPVLRYYYCDMDALGGAALSPDSIVRGIAGDEDEGWPWDVVDFAYSWRGGTQVDVSSLFGDETDLLKYRSQWVFNKTATKAVCLRDYGPLVGPSTGRRGYQVYATSLFGSFSDGLYPATVVLEFTHTDAGVAHALSFRPPTGPSVTIEQIAVDFDDSDALVYAYRTPATVSSNGAPPIGDTDPRRFRFSSTSASAYFVVGTGPWEAEHSADLQNRYEITDPALSDWSKVHVLDVRRGVFLGERTVNTFCSVQTSTPVVSVQTIISGAHVRHTSIANPTNILVQQSLCYSTASGSGAFMWVATLAIGCLVQGFYASQGADYVVGFVAIPQPNTMRVLDTWPSPLGPCTTPGSGGCVPTIFDWLSDAHFMLSSELVHLGHFITSSFADTAQLQALTAANGSEFRSLYARVV